jgi:serine/threonine protein kinase
MCWGRRKGIGASFLLLSFNKAVLTRKERCSYLILDVLGQGTFGQVVKCQNLKTGEIVAVKVVKNKPAYFQQSMMEVTILELVRLSPFFCLLSRSKRRRLSSSMHSQINNQWDKNDEHHMLRLKDTFIHQSHLCLVFELLSNNLYELIKQNSFRGLSTSLVRVFTAQLLDALSVLNEAKIIHCDLKPENILLKSFAPFPYLPLISFYSHFFAPLRAQPPIPNDQSHRLRFRLPRKTNRLHLHPIALLPFARSHPLPPVQQHDRYVEFGVHLRRVVFGVAVVPRDERV